MSYMPQCLKPGMESYVCGGEREGFACEESLDLSSVGMVLCDKDSRGDRWGERF